jgi:hypothetical protein
LTHCWDAPLCCGVVVDVVLEPLPEEDGPDEAEDPVGLKVPFEEPQLELAFANAVCAVDRAPSTRC